MKRSEILDLTYDAILHRPSNVGQWWYLCWVESKIQCLPMNHQPKPEIIFRKCTEYQLLIGFDSTQWAGLEAKIYTFLKEKGLCQIQ